VTEEEKRPASAEGTELELELGGGVVALGVKVASGVIADIH
jgi:hypothetical protein